MKHSRNRITLFALTVAVVLLLVALVFVGTIKLAENNRNELRSDIALLSAKLDRLAEYAPERGIDGLDGADGLDAPVIVPKDGQSVRGPRGAKGADGKSAYDIWVANGNEGDEQTFLDSLKGQDGEPGRPVEVGLDPITKVLSWRYVGDGVWQTPLCTECGVL